MQVVAPTAGPTSVATEISARSATTYILMPPISGDRAAVEQVAGSARVVDFV